MNALVILAACVSAGSAQHFLGGHAGVYAPAAAPSHQFHAQDEFGQFSFGHAGGPSARSESRNAYGVTTGSYQYIDGSGLLQTVNYIADPVNGFRVEGTNLPVGPAALVTEPLVQAPFDLPLPVAPVDTAEVAAAKAAHAAAHAAIAERKKRDVVAAAGLPLTYAGYAGHGLIGAGYAGHGLIGAGYAGHGLVGAGYAGHGLVGAGYAGLGHAGLGYGLVGAAPATIVSEIAHAAPVHAPLAYHGVAAAAAAPAAEATLTTVKLNPGHAIAYRVYPDIA